MEAQSQHLIKRVVIKEILDYSATHKSMAVLAEIEGQPAVLKMEKKAFRNDVEETRGLFERIDFSKISHANDIYYKYQLLFDKGTLS